MKDATRFLPFFKIRQPNGAETFSAWFIANVKGHVPNRSIEVKPAVDQSFESLNSEVIYFLLCAVF